MPVLQAYPLYLFLLFLVTPGSAQVPSSAQQPNPPALTAPQALTQPKAASQLPCQIKRDGSALLLAGAAGAVAPDPANLPLSPNLEPTPCPPLAPLINWYARFLNGPQVKPLTAREKGLLAIRNLMDPYNALTIAANSAIFIGSSSRSAYGPGMRGFGKNVGVSYAEDGIGEFLGTFLIPSIVHQDPHYHRAPGSSIPRRIAQAIYQVAWTQSDDGRGMLNYASLLGSAIDRQLENLYVPGLQTNGAATASRYFIALGTASADNLIAEFLPDVSRHVHFRIVFVQRIINRVAHVNSNQ